MTDDDRDGSDGSLDGETLSSEELLRRARDGLFDTPSSDRPSAFDRTEPPAEDTDIAGPMMAPIEPWPETGTRTTEQAESFEAVQSSIPPFEASAEPRERPERLRRPDPVRVSDTIETPTSLPPPAAPSPSPPRRRRTFPWWAAAILVFGGVSIFRNFAGDESPSPTEPGEVFVTDELEIGSCFVIAGSEIDVTGCNVPHTHEKYALTLHPAGEDAPFPGDASLDRFAADSCAARFDEYVGTERRQSGLEISFFTPVEEAWDAFDERAVDCALSAVDDRMLGASVRGSGGITYEGFRLPHEMTVGDCTDDPEDPTHVLVPLVSCTAPHDNEVFAVVQSAAEPGTPYPGEDAVLDEAQDACIAEFPAFVGSEYLTSSLEVFAASYPTEFSWDDGDRRIVCALYDLEFAKLEGSMKGSGR